MRNRAKCKLCKSVIESFHEFDYVTCKCGEISIDGGLQKCRAMAKSWENFLRVDDNDDEIIVTVKDAEEQKESIEPVKSGITRDELLITVNEMIKNVESLPERVMNEPINHYDYASLLMLISSILKCE